MKRILTLTLIAFLLLPNITMAAYDPYCSCDHNLQIIGGTPEENQKLNDYFNKPRSSSIADIDNSTELERAWYKTAKDVIIQNRKQAKAEYEKALTTYPKEYVTVLKKNFDEYMVSMEASDYAVDKVHTDIANGSYKYSSQIVSQKIVQYVDQFGKNKGKIIPNQDMNNSPIFIKIDNEVQTFSQQPTIVNGSTLVPMRTIFEKLGAKIEWDDATKSVKGTKGNQSVKLNIGSATAVVNGKTMTIDTSPVIINETTMVPIRIVSEAFGARVEWNNDYRTVIINTK